MSQYDELWQAAEFKGEWNHDGLRYKLLEVPREAIDAEDDTSFGALMVVGIDSGNVRRVDELYDPAYSRMDKSAKQDLAELLTHAPVEHHDLINDYLEAAKAPQAPDIISISWCTDDVMQCAESNGKKLTTEQARAVLSYLKHKHDASQGINWDVISAVIAEKVWE